MENVFNEKIRNILSLFGNCFDIEQRSFSLKDNRYTVMFVDENTDKELLAKNIIAPLTQKEWKRAPNADEIVNFVACPVKIESAFSEEEIAGSIAEGNVVLLAEGFGEALVMNLRKVAMRPVSEPPTSPVLKGPREGFCEDLITTLSLLRRRLKKPKLRFEKLSVGIYTNTDLAIVWIKGITDERLVAKIRERIEKIDIDGVLDSSYLVRYLEEKRNSLFRQIGTTEKPNILAAKMLEGRIGVIVDGSPIALTMPFLIFETIQDSNDYHKRDWRISMIRCVRVIAVFLAVILPAYYVALQEFQYQLLPLKFLITLKNATQGLPLTPTLETLLVLILFEVLNEAGIRMPRYVGMALSVVGAIVLGDTAVKAGILSSAAVLIIAVSGIGLYCVPDDAGVFSVLRILGVSVAGVSGVFGLTLFVLVILVYVCGMNEYATPYLAPFSPIIMKDLKDGILKEGVDEMKTRPFSIPNINETRQGDTEE